MVKYQKDYERIMLAHGSGGRLTHELVKSLFKAKFSNPELNALDDAASLKLQGQHSCSLAFSTDSFVVTPIFFPGSDIGRLSVCGTVNDLAMKGSKPLWLSVSAIIEEGLEIEVLKKIADSISSAAKEAGVKIVTGDTKVVEKGKADKLFLTTSGIGLIRQGIDISGSNARDGDAVVINGSIAEHGIAILAARNEFMLNTEIESDCAPLNGLVNKMLSKSKNIHVLRDPTRGGLATTLNEIALSSDIGIVVEENLIPIHPDTKAACNLLGIDPMYVANEGKLICILPENETAGVLDTMRRHKYGKHSTAIGRIVNQPKGVWLKTSAGGTRPLIMLEGEQLPRIC